MMRLQPSTMSYLNGQKFDDSFCLYLASDTPNTFDRVEILKRLVANKKIIHIGCVDHLPLVDQKRSAGLWLHDILSRSSARCVGVDLNKEGCAYLRQLKVPDIYCFDIIKDPVPEELQRERFDYIILGEIIEHVDNPVEFLTSLREKFSKIAKSVILTTPNAFRLQNIVNSIRKIECINSDHRYWFSPYTLAKVLSQAGYRDLEIDTAWFSLPRQKPHVYFLKILIGSLFPVMKDTLIARVSLEL